MCKKRSAVVQRVAMGFRENPYDVYSFMRERGQSTDRILVYVDDLFITADAEHALDEIDETLRKRYEGVISKKGLIYEYLVYPYTVYPVYTAYGINLHGFLTPDNGTLRTRYRHCMRSTHCDSKVLLL